MVANQYLVARLIFVKTTLRLWCNKAGLMLFLCFVEVADIKTDDRRIFLFYLFRREYSSSGRNPMSPKVPVEEGLA